MSRQTTHPDERKAVMVIIGDNIRRAREATGRSQAEAGRWMGMNPAWYSRIENGHASASLWTLVRIAEALGVSVSRLLDGVTEDRRQADEAERSEQR
jgi:transcriptional regulator with XRE-family HTH domain